MWGHALGQMPGQLKVVIALSPILVFSSIVSAFASPADQALEHRILETKSPLLHLSAWGLWGFWIRVSGLQPLESGFWGLWSLASEVSAPDSLPKHSIYSTQTLNRREVHVYKFCLYLVHSRLAFLSRHPRFGGIRLNFWQPYGEETMSWVAMKLV